MLCLATSDFFAGAKKTKKTLPRLKPSCVAITLVEFFSIWCFLLVLWGIVLVWVLDLGFMCVCVLLF